MSFDRLAPFYQAMEFIAAGGKLQRCRFAFLDEIPAPRKVLLAGEGHGRFLPECVRRFPGAAITVVDSSAGMLEIAKRKPGVASVAFVQADLLEWEPPDGGFDLIVTHFFLDCFAGDTLAAVVSRLGKLAAPEAHWLVADFAIARSRFARLRSRVILAMLYRFFNLTCGLKAGALEAPDQALEAAGFSLQRRVTREWGLLKSEWWHRG